MAFRDANCHILKRALLMNSYTAVSFYHIMELKLAKEHSLQKALEAVCPMDRERFERLVAKVVEDLPEEFATRLSNIDIVVQDRPTRSQVARAGLRHGETLLGVYEGVPQTKRGRHYGLVPPDKITIFQKPIEAICKDDTELVAEIESVVKHEIAHHFGISDARLRQIEKGNADHS